MDLLTLPRSAVWTALGVATALRGVRVFHPNGTTHTATVTVSGGGDWGAELLDRPAVHTGLDLGAVLDGEDRCSVPTTGARDLQPVELFRTLRAWSYEASQAGRGD